MKKLRKYSISYIKGNNRGDTSGFKWEIKEVRLNLKKGEDLFEFVKLLKKENNNNEVVPIFFKELT
jgi:hypothetical protein